MNFKACFVCCIFSLFVGTTMSAQDADNPIGEKNEIGLIAGVTFTPGRALSPGSILPGGDSSLTSKPSLALGVDYDRHILSLDWFAVYGGVDFLASPFDVKLSQAPVNASPQYAYLFLTPHVRVKFHPDSKLSPWLSIGGGYANFKEKSPTVSLNAFTQGTNRAVLELGGGLDTQPVTHFAGLPIAFRVEIRDFYSGVPNYGVTLLHNHQHNIVAGAGLLIRF